MPIRNRPRRQQNRTRQRLRDLSSARRGQQLFEGECRTFCSDRGCSKILGNSACGLSELHAGTFHRRSGSPASNANETRNTARLERKTSRAAYGTARGHSKATRDSVGDLMSLRSVVANHVFARNYFMFMDERS